MNNSFEKINPFENIEGAIQEVKVKSSYIYRCNKCNKCNKCNSEPIRVNVNMDNRWLQTNKLCKKNVTFLTNKNVTSVTDVTKLCSDITPVTFNKKTKEEKCNKHKGAKTGVQEGVVTFVTSVTSKKSKFLEKVKSLLANPTEEELQFLYELYEERAAIIEYDGEYCREMAEKHAMEQIRRLCVAKTEGIDDKGFISTGMTDKDGLPIKVEASYDITKIEENTGKTPPYLKESVLAKGIDLEFQQIKDFLKKSSKAIKEPAYIQNNNIILTR